MVPYLIASVAFLSMPAAMLLTLQTTAITLTITVMELPSHASLL